MRFVEGADNDSADIGSGFNIDNNFGAFNPKDVELSGDQEFNSYDLGQLQEFPV